MKRTLWIYQLIFYALLAGLGGTVSAGNGKPDPSQEPPRSGSSETGNQDNTDTEEQEPFLRFTSELRDQSLTSGERAQLRCRVESWPNNRMSYTWYKNNMVFTGEDDEFRISIRNKVTGSRLLFRELLTSDSGDYRCEASNGVMRIAATAKLKVSFSLPPMDDHVTKIPEGKCEIYDGKACDPLLQGKNIYVDPFISQVQMEAEITQALQHISSANYISSECKKFAVPAFCNFVFSPCEYKIDKKSGKRKASRIKLCREDCELMKYDLCSREYLKNKKEDFLQEIFNTANCSMLPATSAKGTKCTKIGLPAVSDQSQTCFNDSTGSNYKGVSSRTKTGKQCQVWPTEMVIQHKELAGGHNFCRNPGKEMEVPWCYTNTALLEKEVCNVPKCALPAKNVDIVIILVPSVAIPFVLACVMVGLCVCRKRKAEHSKNKNGSAKFTMGQSLDLANLNSGKIQVPELNAASVHLMGEIGDSIFGKVYTAKILSNPQFSTNFPVAVKSLRDTFVSTQAKEFQRELEAFATLQHENVACLKAIVIQPALRCMIFEYTDKTDLQEYLVSHSPQGDFAQPPASSASSHVSSVMDQNDFMKMAMQIASGMEYLSSNNYIHRDLAARNVLVCGNTDLKISNLGVVRDSYLSCYYRAPQGGQMLPIRWMAPESLHCWQFSDKSTVWSFGVLVWEIFSYGMQPYCGYSNHEVLDVISRRQLLSCPDQCPAKMYSLMHECWAAQPSQRPDFKAIRAKLQGWDNSSTGRMTSQLAQGIHRQLTTATRDGAGQYNRYYQASSIGGSSGITYNTIMGPTPPPQYSNSYQHPGSYPEHPNPPSNSGIDSQQQFSTETNSYPVATGHYVPGFQDNSIHSSQGRSYGGGNVSSSDEHHVYQQRNGMHYRKGPASQSSSSSCTSSSRDQYAPMHIRRQYNADNRYQDNLSPPPPFSGPGNRYLSGVVENERDSEREDQYLPAPPFPNPLQISTAHLLSSNNAPTNNSKLPQSGPKQECSDISTGSGNAASCDSGLPPEDPDLTTVDPKTPLINRPPPPVQYKSALRVTTPRKQI